MKRKTGFKCSIFGRSTLQEHKNRCLSASAGKHSIILSRNILIDLSTIFQFIVDKSTRRLAFTQSKSQPGLGPGWLSFAGVLGDAA
jgi:hypothetical protein